MREPDSVRRGGTLFLGSIWIQSPRPPRSLPKPPSNPPFTKASLHPMGVSLSFDLASGMEDQGDLRHCVSSQWQEDSHLFHAWEQSLTGLQETPSLRILSTRGPRGGSLVGECKEAPLCADRFSTLLLLCPPKEGLSSHFSPLAIAAGALTVHLRAYPVRRCLHPPPSFRKAVAARTSTPSSSQGPSVKGHEAMRDAAAKA